VLPAIVGAKGPVGISSHASMTPPVVVPSSVDEPSSVVVLPPSVVVVPSVVDVLPSVVVLLLLSLLLLSLLLLSLVLLSLLLLSLLLLSLLLVLSDPEDDDPSSVLDEDVVSLPVLVVVFVLLLVLVSGVPVSVSGSGSVIVGFVVGGSPVDSEESPTLSVIASSTSSAHPPNAPRLHPQSPTRPRRRMHERYARSLATSTAIYGTFRALRGPSTCIARCSRHAFVQRCWRM
jgi:hypothetical protein